MYYIGIDLGGTNIAAGIVAEDGKIIIQDSVPTLKERPTEEIMDDMADLCLSLCKKSSISMDEINGIGIGCPGTVDNENGVIIYSNNIPMDNVKMREYLNNKLNKPINLENDANAAALGEYAVNGKGVKSYMLITLGTGIGGGVVIDGKIYRGFNGVGAEVGHMTLVSGGIKCTCGNVGCWERYASVTALINQTREALEKYPDSIMHTLVEAKGKVSGRTAFDAAKQGDKAGEAVVAQYERYIADGIISMINIFEPEILAVGGGISKEGDYLLDPVREYVKAHEYNKYRPKTEIVTAKLFNDAGIIGAAMSTMK